MISSFLRNVGRFLVWIAVVVAVVIVNFWAIPEHYLQLKGGLEMAGFETQPLASDELLGPLFGVIFPEATLPLLMALTIAVVELLSLYLWFYEIFEVLALAGHRHENRLAGQAEEVREATRRIVQSGMMLLFMSALLFWVIRWDVEIFRFRSLYSAFGPEGPATPGDVASWNLQLRDHADQYVVWLAQYGAWGYIAVTAASALALEWVFLKMGVSFAQVMRPIDSAWDRWVAPYLDEPEMAVFEEPAAPMPVDAEEVPAAQDSTAADVPGVGDPSMAVASGEILETPSVTPSDAQVASTESVATPFIAPLEAAPPVQHEQPLPRPPVRVGAQAPRHDVIGMVPASRVTLEEALADQSLYHVDRAQGRVTIWDRAYWTVLRNHHAPDPVSEKEEAPV